MSEARPVEINGLRHHFAVKGTTVQALERIDLSIEPGQFLCLAGPSGCGKTTLLRLIAGFMQPTEGTIGIGGEPVRKPGADRGVVFQQPNLYPWMNVRDNVELGPKLRGVPKQERSRDRRALPRDGGHRRLRRPAALRAVRRDAAALPDRPGAHQRPADHPHGRALRCAGRPDPRAAAERAAGHLARDAQDHRVHHPQRRRGRVPGDAGAGDEPPPGRIVLDESAIFTETEDWYDAEKIRALPKYIALREKVSHAIHSEMSEAEAARAG